MPTISARVIASADDASEKEDTGVVTLTAITVTSQAASTAANRHWAAFRFVLSGITMRDTINDAIITIYYSKTPPIDVDIHFQLAASPVAFTTTTNDIQNRTRTTAKVTWTDTALDLSGQNSPSLVGVLQEVVNAYTPTSFVVIFKPRTISTVTCPITAFDSGGGSSVYAMLTIIYNPRERIHIASTP